MDSFSSGTSWRRWVRRGRRVTLVVAALWCVVLSIGIIGSMVAEGTLAKAGTATLLGVVGMLVLPGLTALALRLDSRERRRMDLIKGKPTTGVVAHAAHPEQSHRREAPAHRARSAPGRLAGERAA